MTGGHSGLAVPDPVLFGFSLGAPLPFYFLCLAMLALVLWLLLNLTRSATGRAFVGVRDSEAAAQGLGIHVARTKVLAFVISAAVSGLAGALLAHQTQFITPESFGLALSLQLVLMVFIGGMGSLRGAILGALLIGMLPSLISLAKPLLPAASAASSGSSCSSMARCWCSSCCSSRAASTAAGPLRSALDEFPLRRRGGFRRQKAYMRSERG